MELGLIGLPQSGKTTIYNAVAGAELPVGVGARKGLVRAAVPVPDERLGRLIQRLKPKKWSPASFNLADVTGLIQGGGAARTLDAELLAKVREFDALALVVRAFADPAVPHPLGGVDPGRDLAECRTELMLADLAQVERRIEALERDSKRPTPTREADLAELDSLRRCKAALEEERPISSVGLSDSEERALRGFRFLTEKPWIVVLNQDEEGAASRASTRAFESAHDSARMPPGEAGAYVVKLPGKLEMEISELPENERLPFRQELGAEVPAGDALGKALFKCLDLRTFYTVLSGDIRAWVVPAGATAIEAAGKIHTDMAKSFIRAEAVGADELIEAGDMKSLKSAGRLRVEGKDYEVRDGDVLTIRFGG